MRKLLVFLLASVALAATTAAHARASLNYDVDTFRCSESILGGFDYCSGDISVKIDGASERAISANVTCEVRVSYQDDNTTLPSTATDLAQGMVLLTYGAGTARLPYRASVSSIIGKTIRAKLTGIQCRGQVLD